MLKPYVPNGITGYDYDDDDESVREIIEKCKEAVSSEVKKSEVK